MCNICHQPTCRPDPEYVEELQEELREWRRARRALASGVQSYTIADRSITRASLRDVKSMITEIENELESLCKGYGRGARVLTGIPRDNL